MRLEQLALPKRFKRAEQRGVALTADARLTVDVSLEPGQVTETVQVSTALGETVNNTSGEVARVIDSQQVQNLALNGRNYIQLLSLIPGVAQTTDDQLELSTSLATNQQSINGNRGQIDYSAIDTTERYDLVVVGGGISGLSAAHYFRQAVGPGA